MAQQTLRPIAGYYSLTGASGTTNSSTFINSANAYTTVDEVTLNTTDKIVVGYAGSGASTTVDFSFSDYTRISKIISFYGTIYTFLDDTLSSEYYDFGSSTNEYTPFVVINTDLSGIPSVSTATLKLYPTGTQYGMLGRTLRIRIYDSPDAELPAAVGDISGYYTNTLAMTTYSFLTNEVSSFISIDVTSLINSIITKYGYCTNPLFMIEMLPNGELSEEFIYVGSSNKLEITYQPATNTIPPSSPLSIFPSFQSTALSVIPQSGYMHININKYNSAAYNGGLRQIGLFARKPDGTSVTIGNYSFVSGASGISATATTHNFPITCDYDSASEAYNNGYVPYIRTLLHSSGETSLVDKDTFSVYINQIYATVFGDAPSTQSCTMYIQGPLPNNSGNTLYTQGPLPNNSGIPLYLDCKIPSGEITLHTLSVGTIATGITLYTFGHVTRYSGCDLFVGSDVNSNIPLFISGPSTTDLTKNTTLFIRTDYSQSGSPTNNCTLHTISYSLLSGELPLYLAGPDSDIIIGSHPLFISGPIPNSGTKTANLFIANNFGSGNNSTTLFVSNTTSTSSSGNLPIFIDGIGTGAGGSDNRNGAIPLHITSHFNDSGTIPIYIVGGIEQAFLPVVMFGKSWDSITSGVPLIIESTTNSGLNRFSTLYIKSDGETASLPLFVGSSESDENSDSINLFLNNNTVMNFATTLFVKNTVETLNSGVKLTVSGTGVNNGYNYDYNSMNLYINRGSEGVDKFVTLHISTPSGITNGTDMFLAAARTLNSGINLVIPTVLSNKSGNTSIYTHGF